jgi:hypothetical protein
MLVVPAWPIEISSSEELLVAAGMIVWDNHGDIILSACRQLPYCRDALEAELCAVLEGLSLALHWCNSPTTH